MSSKIDNRAGVRAENSRLFHNTLIRNNPSTASSVQETICICF